MVTWVASGDGQVFHQIFHMRTVVLAAIVAYQRCLSPYKGFCCAYRLHTGRQSCSALGFRAVRRYGVLVGFTVLRRRTYLCGVVHRRYCNFRSRARHLQNGFCDVGCDLPCDVSGLDGCLSIGDVASCCDWPTRNRKGNDQEEYVYIPPDVGEKREKRD
jgi:putative component of membrane protein insertase Oxa1/YidC/SpoIIIJ protein YidD